MSINMTTNRLMSEIKILDTLISQTSLQTQILKICQMLRSLYRHTSSGQKFCTPHLSTITLHTGTFKREQLSFPPI